MGNEMSAEADDQALNAGFDIHQLEPAVSNAVAQKPEESPKSREEEMRPLHDAQLSKLMKIDSSGIDINDTGVSDELQKLLATLHEDDGPPVPGAHLLSIPTLQSAASKPAFSAAAQEFVPGKPFNLGAVGAPTIDREVSSVSSDPVGLSNGFGTLKADAPEFVPSWQSKPAATGGVLPLPTTAAAAANVRVVDKKVWYYRDPAGIVRGPFSTTEMRAWSDKGYFTGTLEIALSDRGPYLPLSAVYPAPERPFWKSIEPREFATRMRQHIVTTQGGMTSEAQSN